MKKIQYIELLKEIVRKLQEKCDGDNGYLIDCHDHEMIISQLREIKLEKYNELEEIMNIIMCYDKANSDDKLRSIYEQLDEFQAQINVIEIIDNKDADEDDEGEDKVFEHFLKFKISKSNIEKIDSLSDYAKFIHELNLNYLSRGQANYEWPLLPSALRMENNERKYAKQDVDLMNKEFKKSLAYYDKAYNSSRNRLEFLAYAQHFSIPTNLLDFTESHLISLLFSLEEFSTEDCAVIYFVDALNFNKSRCNISDIPNCSQNEELESGASSVFIKSDSVNERIFFQKGYFLKIPSNYDKVDVLEEIKDFCKIVVIPWENKYEILVDLFKMGLGFENIYPDLDNMAKTIKFRNMMRNKEVNNE